MAARTTEGVLQVGDKTSSWIRQGTVSSRPLVLLAHGAGAPYTHPFMEKTAEGLVKRGCCVARFHFPYMEEVHLHGKRKPPNTAKVLLATWEAMLEVAESWKNHGAIVMAGKSMGGRMASMLLAEGRASSAAAAVYLGYPLHAPGKSDKLRKDHLEQVPVPQLFVSGTRDNLAKLELLEPIVKSIRKAKLHIVDRGDHSLAPTRKDPFAGMDDWLDVVAAFIDKHA